MIKPISKPLAQIKAEYTVVVVGSGYGAGVAASRLSRAGQSVCVLERGKEILPGQYPVNLASSQGAMQADTSRGKLGSPYGMFNVHVNPDMLAVVGCGLGGTSLINANVALEMDERLFGHTPAWPAEFRQGTALLAPFAQRARDMLDPKPYPDHFPPLNKLAALETSAKVMKQPFYKPPICVNFEDQINPFGVPQAKCTRCGDCCSGCNDGAKNTTLMNYLPDANNHGAEIFTQARVSHVAREGDGWRVHFFGPTPSDDPAVEVQSTAMSVKARFVMLGAGSLGSTEILLRSRREGLSLSARLGQHFSGNGDVLAFGYNNHGPADAKLRKDKWGFNNLYGIGRGDNVLKAEELPGPCITGIIDLRKTAQRVEDGLVIEEGVIPGTLATMIPPGAFMADALFGNFLQYGPTQAAARLLEAQQEGNTIMNDPGSMTQLSYDGAVSRTQTYLVMGVDDAGGTLALRDDRLRIDWPDAGRADVIARDNEWLKQANEAIQGHFIPNPIWTEPQGYKLVTVHPVGGCGMGNDAASGVVNHKCQVFSSSQGTAVHAGLYVCDGAVMPGAVGVNPLLTITAVAERACALLAQDQGWTIDYAMAARQPLLPPAPAAAAPQATPAESSHDTALAKLGHKLRDWLHQVEHAVLDEIHGVFGEVVKAIEDGAIEVAKALLREVIKKYPELLSPSFQFDETMHGFVSLQPVTQSAPARERISTDYEVATAWGRDNGQSLSFALRVHTDHLNQLADDPTHPAKISGSVLCKALSSEPMKVLQGDFHLLPVDADQVETWRMTYDMVLDGPGGKPIHFHGYKVLHQQPGSHWWDDVTRLYITLHDGADGRGKLLAQGILLLDLQDMMWQASSVKVEPAHGMLADLVNHFPQARAAIEMVYMGKFAGFFGGVLFQAYGGLLSNMNNFPAQPGQRPPVRPLKAPKPTQHCIATKDGFFIKLTHYQGGNKGPVILAPGFTVKASSFAIDTVDCNLVETLIANEYDVWLFDYRASPDSGSLIKDRAIKSFNIDDIANTDWPAAVNYVRNATGCADVQVIAHCVGSMSLLMSLLAGKLTGVRSVISSALTLHPVTNWLSYLKVDLDLVRLMDQMDELKDGFNIVPLSGQSANAAAGAAPTDTPVDAKAGAAPADAAAGAAAEQFDHEIDVVAWSVPVPDGEQCKNPVCRRIFSIFGPSYTHSQLNHATHNAMMEMFGLIAIPPFAQLSLIMDRECVVDAQGNDVYLLHEQAQRLALPISFITGGLNQIFDPETVLRTHRWLIDHNKTPGLYDMHVFEGYAHMDMFIGRNAARDIFPHLLERLGAHPQRRAAPAQAH